MLIFGHHPSTERKSEIKPTVQIGNVFYGKYEASRWSIAGQINSECNLLYGQTVVQLMGCCLIAPVAQVCS